MDFEKYTERARGFLQAVQQLAQGRGHQRFTPDHVLMALLDDEQGLSANLIRTAGGDPAVAKPTFEVALAKLDRPSVALGTSVIVRVALGGRRSFKKKNN